MYAGMIDYVADLVRWWAWEARGLVSGPRDGLTRGSSALLRLSRAGAAIETRDGAVRQVAPEETGEALRQDFGTRRALQVDLLVEPDRHLLRSLSPLRLPRSRMRAMAELDRAAATPFRAEDCLLVLPRPRADDPESLYALLRRDHLDPLLDSLKAARITLGGLALATPRGRLAADGPSRAALGPTPRAMRAGRAGLGAAAALALVGLLVLAGALAWRQERALTVLDREIVRAESEAAEVRADLAARQAEIARLAALRGAKSGAVPLVQVLEELALILPDGTWLDSIDIDTGGVVLSGTSQAAAGLIPRLEASPLFREPTFTQPVLRDVEERGERFTIALETGQADG